MSAVRDNNVTSQICTYVIKIQDDEEHEGNADIIRNNFQTILGSEHEVTSLSKMRFSSPDDLSNFQYVIKVKTNSPTYVATMFLGNGWVREDHILFKASESSPHTKISENSKNT